jgi:DNA-binding IclR family transcriptional regulator
MMKLAAASPQSTAIEPLPDEIDSASAKLVYFYLDRAGEATVSELSGALGMKKLGLYSVLGTLDGRGLVEHEGETYRPTDR